MKSLDEVLQYKNERVIEKFREDYYFDSGEAELIFSETVKWLWLAADRKIDVPCAMYHPMLVMDKMWHAFLLFSREYEAFCKGELGRVIYHEPHTRGESMRRLTPTADNPAPLDKLYAEIADFQSYVYDRLGPETLLRWFVQFPHVYSPEELLRRTRPQFSQRGFMRIAGLRNLSKDELLAELAKDHAVAAWCGGPSCGPQCRED